MLVAGFRSDNAINLFVDGVLETFTSLELGLDGSLDLDGFAGTRVASGGRLTMGNAERTEADEANFRAALERASDGIKNCINSFRCVCFGKTGATGDGCY